MISLLLSSYCGCGASTGQTDEQAPQSMHASASITYFVSPAVIALTGHSGSQAPQLMQASSIKYAIVNLLKIMYLCSICGLYQEVSFL